MLQERCFEKTKHDCKLRKLLASLVVKKFHLVMQIEGATASPAIELVVLRWPLDHLWFCCVPERWQTDVNSELHRRVWTQSTGIYVG